MRVVVRLFAVLRERAGRDSVELELERGATVADALAALGEIPELAQVLSRLAVQMAVNRDYASEQTELQAGDELALIPPLSGGSEPHVNVGEHPLRLETVTAAVRDPRAGAVVSFQGVTREVAALEYEAYIEMAKERIAAILDEAVSAHGLCAAAAEHRIGTVALGEPSVIVAASAPHREEAFAGAREIIDRIKGEAPIWKRERDEHGVSRPVPGTPAPGARVRPPGDSGRSR